MRFWRLMCFLQSLRPHFLLSLHDRKYARRPPKPIASGVRHNYKEIMKSVLTSILIFTSILLFGQKNPNEALCQDIHCRILQTDSITKWKIDKQNATLNWTMIDTIYFEPGCCGLTITKWDLERIDTVKLTLRFENGWNTKKIDSLRKNNKEIVNFLKNEAIKYCDSIEWRIKIEKEIFNEYPYKTLNDYWRFRVKGKYDIVNVIRLPDTTINDIGIFIDLNFDYEWFRIYQEKPKQILLSQLDLISFKILKKNKLITGRFEYE